MVRNILLLFLATALAAPAAGRHETLDPAFDKIPFDQWLAERDRTHFHWTAIVSKPQLSFLQRLVAQVEIAVDGKDLENRRTHGMLVFYIQITDHDGTRYREHSHIELDKLDANVKNAIIQSSQRAFLLPGEYRLAVVLLDAASGEHSAIEAPFHVAAPRDSFLLQAWRELPPVEYTAKTETPDSWFVPDLEGRLHWASVNEPAHMNIILNVAPVVTAPGTRATPAAGMPALLPTLKALSQTGSPDIFERMELLDIGRRREVFHQDDVHDLDWTRLKAALGEANTASIDVHALSERHHDAQFFVKEIRRILRSPEKPSVLVVLTTAVAFEPGEDLEPISLESLPRCRVVYIRYHAPSERPVVPFDEGRRRRGDFGMGGPRFGGREYPGEVVRELPDQLEATLKPLNPAVFDVETPAQVTHALLQVEKDLQTTGDLERKF